MKTIFNYFIFCSTLLISTLPLFWMGYFLYFSKEGTGSSNEIVINALLFLSFGIIHSLLARTIPKNIISNLVGKEYFKIIYSIIAGICLFLILHLWKELFGTLWNISGLFEWVLILINFLAVGGIISATSDIDYLSFIGIRNIYRKLKNKPPIIQRFSTKGWYGYSRHPLYFFFFIVLWIWPVMTYTRLEFTIISSLYLIIGTLFEEKNLEQEFGEVYKIYKQNVPMWIPQLKPWRYKRVS